MMMYKLMVRGVTLGPEFGKLQTYNARTYCTDLVPGRQHINGPINSCNQTVNANKLMGVFASVQLPSEHLILLVLKKL
jgi:hypothetical protein